VRINLREYDLPDKLFVIFLPLMRQHSRGCSCLVQEREPIETELDVSGALSRLPFLGEVTFAWPKPGKMIFLDDGNESKLTGGSADFRDTGPVALKRGARVGRRGRLPRDMCHGRDGLGQSHALQKRSTKDRLLRQERLANERNRGAGRFSG